jgi:squalene-hopene/tetraprenyl-beta-curcumene cyclase
VVAFLAQLGRDEDRRCLEGLVDYLRREQEPDGSWFGRWGTNYIYGTWSVLSAFEHVTEIDVRDMVDRGADWLESVQHPDGGWGESNDTYDPDRTGCADGPSFAFQTAWAMLGLIAAGRGRSDAVRRGAEFLLADQRSDGSWTSPVFTAPGFPRVFYLRYHGYSRFFPLWALARTRDVLAGD